MSVQTWKKEFYPSTAIHGKSKAALIAASLKKWIGLRKNNLRKHKLRKESTVLMGEDMRWEDEDFDVCSENCHLCQKYYNEQLQDREDECVDCPIFRHTGGRPCGEEYFHWEDTGDPGPMIRLLQRTLRANDPTGHWSSVSPSSRKCGWSRYLRADSRSAIQITSSSSQGVW